MHNQDLANVLTDRVWFVYNVDHEYTIQDKTVNIMLCYIRWLGRRTDWWYYNISFDHHPDHCSSRLDLETKKNKV